MKKRLFVLCMVLGLMCVGCGNEDVVDYSSIRIEEVEQETSEKPMEQEEEKAGDDLPEKETVDDVGTSEETEKNEDSVEAEFDLFAEMKNREFYFSSGAGGWRTIMKISEDGSFSGEYSDSEMGVTGEGYPNGTYCICTFEGEFTKPVKVNDYTYSVGIADIRYEKEAGTEEIIDGVLYCYSEPYGIDGANSLLFYLPGTPLSELPQEYLDWVRFEVSEAKDDKLSFYGIYNEKEQTGFSSYEILNVIDEMMKNAKAASDVIKTSLENDILTQLEMNEKSSALYEVWDDALNALWAELKNTLPKNEFETLLNEQRAWISEKEKAVEEAGAEVSGGSMEPLVRNMKAAELTEKRVYELYEMLE